MSNYSRLPPLSPIVSNNGGDDNTNQSSSFRATTQPSIPHNSGGCGSGSSCHQNLSPGTNFAEAFKLGIGCSDPHPNPLAAKGDHYPLPSPLPNPDNKLSSSKSPDFYPFSVCIGRIDQWVRIPRLPWEFWDFDTLSTLLKPVGDVIRVDQNTLLRLKGKFDHVCVNIDIAESLPGTLVVSFEGRTMKIPLIYEGLHEVCSLCGSNYHQIETCLMLPSQSRKEVRIEKFGDSSSVVYEGTHFDIIPGQPHLSSTDNWIRVSPKKRTRSFSAKPSRINTNTSVPAKVIISEVNPPMSPIFEVAGSPVKSNEQGSMGTSPLELSTDNIIHANPSAMINMEDPINEDPLHAMKDDTSQGSPSRVAHDSQDVQFQNKNW